MPFPPLNSTPCRSPLRCPRRSARPISVLKCSGGEWPQRFWGVGVLGCVACALAAYARTMRRIRECAVPSNAAVAAMLSGASLSVGLRSSPRLLISAAVQSPALTGFVRPMLLLPASFPGVLTREEARLVLLHELTHLRRYDLPLNWLLCLVQAIHWCNPVLWFAFARMRADRESACDARVLAFTGGDRRAEYGNALLKLEGALAHGRLNLAFVGIFERAAGMRSRMKAIAAHRRAHPAWDTLGVVLIAVLTLAGATRAQTPVDRKVSEHRNSSAAEAVPNTVQSAQLAAQIHRKLNTIIIPRLELREATAREAIAFLRKRSVDLDTTEPDPAKRGVNIVLNIAAPPAPTPGSARTNEPQDPGAVRVTVALTNIPLGEALKYVTGLARLKFSVLNNTVSVVAAGSPGTLITKEFRLTPKIVASLGFKANSDAQALLLARVSHSRPVRPPRSPGTPLTGWL